MFCAQSEQEAGPGEALQQGRAVCGAEPGRRGLELFHSTAEPGVGAELGRRGLKLLHKAEPGGGAELGRRGRSSGGGASSCCTRRSRGWGGAREKKKAGGAQLLIADEGQGDAPESIPAGAPGAMRENSGVGSGGGFLRGSECRQSLCRGFLRCQRGDSSRGSAVGNGSGPLGDLRAGISAGDRASRGVGLERLRELAGKGRGAAFGGSTSCLIWGAEP